MQLLSHLRARKSSLSTSGRRFARQSANWSTAQSMSNWRKPRREDSTTQPRNWQRLELRQNSSTSSGAGGWTSTRARRSRHRRSPAVGHKHEMMSKVDMGAVPCEAWQAQTKICSNT